MSTKCVVKTSKKVKTKTRYVAIYITLMQICCSTNSELCDSLKQFGTHKIYHVFALDSSSSSFRTRCTRNVREHMFYHLSK